MWNDGVTTTVVVQLQTYTSLTVAVSDVYVRSCTACMYVYVHQLEYAILSMSTCLSFILTFVYLQPGHLIFEMSAGYELTQLKPGAGDYRAAHKTVRPILEYIFEEGFPHNITDVIKIEMSPIIIYLSFA